MREYFLFDPTNDYLKPPLQGLELVARDSGRRLPARELAEGVPGAGEAAMLAYWSLQVGIDRTYGLRFHDSCTSEKTCRCYAETAQWRERPARLEAKSLLAQGNREPAGGR